MTFERFTSRKLNGAPDCRRRDANIVRAAQAILYALHTAQKGLARPLRHCRRSFINVAIYHVVTRLYVRAPTLGTGKVPC
jgi:hypothetical protein